MLSGFEALMPYLEAIAAKHGLKPFDREVVEAYWIGNPLLEAFDREDFLRLLEALTLRGLPRSISRRLGEHLPPHPWPHHLFHVAFVGVGTVTGHVPTNLANMEACRPAWADVVQVHGTNLRVRGPALALEGEKVVWGPPVERDLVYDPRVIPDAAPGDTVAVHWGWPAVRLPPLQRAALERYSRRALDEANAVLPGLRGPAGSGAR